MTKRIKIILENILPCKVFADIGCDHGYITKGVLEQGKCEKAYFSDISKECLKKAKTLLEEYESKGEAKGVQGNGFENIDYCDFALIAGMGGEEIISILENSLFLPNKLLLQPMKNVDKLRVYLVEKGYKIVKDFCFEDGKFYEVIVGGKLEDGGQVRVYSDAEYEFGKENLEKMPSAFVKRIQKLLKNTDKYLQDPNLQESSRAALEEKKKRLQGVLNGEIK